MFDTNLKLNSCFGKEGSGYPADLTFDPAGDVYVTDRYNHRIQVFSQNGTFLRTFGRHGSGPGELSEPWGICVDHDGGTTVYQYSRHIWSILCDHIT